MVVGGRNQIIFPLASAVNCTTPRLGSGRPLAASTKLATFTPQHCCPAARSSSQAVTVVASRFLPARELYDPTTGTWTKTGSLPVARYGHTATLLPNGKVLVEGGWNDKTSFASAELYDPMSGKWTATGSLVTAVYYHTATLLPDGMVLVAGGQNGLIPKVRPQVYDPTSGTWTATGRTLPQLGGAAATLLLDGTVLVTGGDKDANFPTSVSELYDPGAGPWFSPANSTRSALSTQRRCSPAAKCWSQAVRVRTKLLPVPNWVVALGGDDASSLEAARASAGLLAHFLWDAHLTGEMRGEGSTHAKCRCGDAHLVPLMRLLLWANGTMPATKA